jgi:pimeloyl-ACP methyl ester carboxylesterase
VRRVVLLFCLFLATPALAGVSRFDRFVLVPGALSMGPMSFGAHKRRLGDRAIRSRHNTRATQASNTEKLADTIAAAGRNIALVGHSQGGPLAHRTLAKYQELIPRVALLMFLNSPVTGNYLAEGAVAVEAGHKAAVEALSRPFDPMGRYAVLRKSLVNLGYRAAYGALTLGGSWDAVSEFTTSNQAEFLDSEAAQRVLREIPRIVTVSAEGDWVVRPEHAHLPQARQFRYGHDVDHFSLVITGIRSAAWQMEQFEHLLDL